jgi:cephalosporin hydroxylase
MNTHEIWDSAIDKVVIDTRAGTVELGSAGGTATTSLYSEQAFRALSKLWLSVGWSRRYSYTFSWLGRPVIQLPEDLLRYQETIFQLRPDVVIETGVAHGGSLVFVASVLELLGHGRVIGVDIEIRPHNRQAIEAHPLFKRITLVEGSSTDPAIVAQVRAQIRPTDKVLVLLDSCHTAEHVLAELRCYAPLVSVGSYLLVADGLMPFVADVPGAQPWFAQSNPIVAMKTFLAENRDFQNSEPPQQFNESKLSACLTYWPQGWLKRVQ